MPTEEQLITTQETAFANMSWGQRLTISNRTVKKLSFPLLRYGSPGGTVTFLIRKALNSPNDTILATKLWGNSNDVPSVLTWLEVTFDTPILINEEVRILACATGTSDYPNTLAFYNSWPTLAKANEKLTQRSAGGVYTDDPTGYDSAYIYTYDLPPVVGSKTAHMAAKLVAAGAI